LDLSLIGSRILVSKTSLQTGRLASGEHPFDPSRLMWSCADTAEQIVLPHVPGFGREVRKIIGRAWTLWPPQSKPDCRPAVSQNSISLRPLDGTSFSPAPARPLTAWIRSVFCY